MLRYLGTLLASNSIAWGHIAKLLQLSMFHTTVSMYADFKQNRKGWCFLLLHLTWNDPDTSYLIHMNARFVTKTTNANEKQAPTNQQQSLRNECSQTSGLRSEKNMVKKYFLSSLQKADTGRWVYTSSRRTWSCHIVTFGFSAKGTSDFPQVTWERDRKRRAEACSADNAGMQTTFFKSN